jgi:hypothetical protein
VVLQCEAITDIDVTAAGMLQSLDDELNAEGVHLAFVEMRHRLQSMALRYGLMGTLDADHFYPSLDTALAAITSDPAAGIVDGTAPDDHAGGDPTVGPTSAAGATPDQPRPERTDG